MTEHPSYVQNNIFVELGLANLPDDQKLILLEQMNELIHKRAMLKILDSLSDDQKANLLAEQGSSPETQMKKMMELLPNMGEIIFAEVEEVKNEIKASVLIKE